MDILSASLMTFEPSIKFYFFSFVKMMMLLVVFVMSNIATLNVHGLRSPGKHQALKSFLNLNNIDIAFLQETHFVSATDDWTNLYDGNSVWAGSDRHSKGVGLVFRKGANVNIRGVVGDPGGRFIILNVTYNLVKLTLINVFVPIDHITVRLSCIFFEPNFGTLS